MRIFTRRFAALAAICALAAPAAAAATQPAPRATRDAPAAEEDRDQRAGERRICVREAITGSRMARTVCRTEREWRLLQGD